MAAYPPSIRNSPCARLMTRIMPKMIASPTLISARLAIAYRTWIARRATRSTFAFPKQELRAGPLSNLDHVLLVVGRVLDKVADGGGIGRLLLGEILQHLELLVGDFGDVHVEHAMVRRRIDGDLAGGRIDADPSLQGLDDLHPIDAASLLDSFRPQPESLIGTHREFGDVRIVGAEAVEKTRHELLVDRVLQ